MRTALCHFSLSRRWKREQWTPERLVREVEGLGACMRALRTSGYQGFVALEYEAAEEEQTAVTRSVAHMRRLLAEVMQS